MFHCLSASNADRLVGKTQTGRSLPVWTQTYRALEHRTARNRCRDRDNLRHFAKPIRDFAEVFVFLGELREDADYDPESVFYVSEFVYWSAVAKSVIERFEAVPARDLGAFAAYVLLPFRNKR